MVVSTEHQKSIWVDLVFKTNQSLLLFHQTKEILNLKVLLLS